MYRTLALVAKLREDDLINLNLSTKFLHEILPHSGDIYIFNTFGEIEYIFDSIFRMNSLDENFEKGFDSNFEFPNWNGYFISDDIGSTPVMWNKTGTIPPIWNNFPKKKQI